MTDSRLVRVRQAARGWYLSTLAESYALAGYWPDRIGALVYADSMGWRVVRG